MTCHRLRRLHARCRTWSAASHCAWCTTLDRVDVSQKKNCHLHHITSCSLLFHVSCLSVVSRVRCPVCRVSLCCLTCPLSRVSLFCVSCPGSQTVTRRYPIVFSRWPQKVLTHGDFCAVPCGCGTPAQAQASARVDVPTARVFPAWTKESNACASFRANAWICVHQSTDRDLESFNVNAWIRACQTTDHGYMHGGQPTVISRVST